MGCEGLQPCGAHRGTAAFDDRDRAAPAPPAVDRRAQWYGAVSGRGIRRPPAAHDAFSDTWPTLVGTTCRDRPAEAQRPADIFQYASARASRRAGR